MPDHIQKIEAEGIHQVKLIDATPIGINVRSTVATYANVHDELRKDSTAGQRRQSGWAIRPEIFPTTREVCAARSAMERARSHWMSSFLPDVDIPCPECRGSRYGKQAKLIRYTNKDGEERVLAGTDEYGCQRGRCITAGT